MFIHGELLTDLAGRRGKTFLQSFKGRIHSWIDGHHIGEPGKFQNVANAAIQVGQGEPAGGVFQNAGIDADQEADAGGIDIIDLAEVSEDLAVAGILDLFGLAAQVHRILTGNKAAVQADDADIATILKFNEHAVSSIVLQYPASGTSSPTSSACETAYPFDSH